MHWRTCLEKIPLQHCDHAYVFDTFWLLDRACYPSLLSMGGFFFFVYYSYNFSRSVHACSRDIVRNVLISRPQ